MTATVEVPETKPRRGKTAAQPTTAGFAVSLDRDRLLPYLNAAARCANEKSSRPNSRNLLLETQDGELLVSAANEMRVIQQTADVIGESPGMVSVIAGDLAAIVAALPPGGVSLSKPDVEGTELVIKGARGEFRITTFPDEYFPVIPTLEGETVEIRLKAEQLQALIRETIHSAKDDDPNGKLNTIAARIKDGRITCWATDTSRLATRSEPVRSEQEIEVLLPLETCREMARLVPDGCEVALVFTPNQILMRLPYLSFWSRLVVGTAANYEKPLSKCGTEKVVLLRVPFLETLKRLRLAQADSGRTLFEFGSSLVLKAAGGKGRCEEEFDLIASGPSMRLTANANLFFECLEAWREEQIEMLLAGSQMPILLRPVGSEAAWSIVMTMSMGETE